MKYIKNPKTTILMCTFNGEKYLMDQLRSFETQSIARNLNIIVSDDGSSDRTLKILRDFKKKTKIQIRIFSRDAAHGFSSNFAFVSSRKTLKSDFYAWSDQDDVWINDKLERAVKELNAIDPKVPAVFSSRTIITNDNNIKIGESKNFTKPYVFENALVQSVAGGNTMVFNESARILFNIASKTKKISSHDWLMYIVTTGCGGIFICESSPLVRYRQHDKNLIGTNITLKSIFVRVRSLFSEKLKNSISINKDCISLIENYLTKENKYKFKKFYSARDKSIIYRFFRFLNLQIYRQGYAENFLFYIALLFNKI